MSATCGQVREGRIRWVTVLAALAAAGAVLGSCRAALSNGARSGPTVLHAGVGPVSLTSATAGLRQVGQLLSVESLVRMGEDGRLEPWLAENWTITNGGRSLVMRVRPGISFHDGTPADANAIAQMLPEAVRSQFGSIVDDVQRVSAADGNALQIDFRHASPLLLETLEASIRKPGATAIGTGPFVRTSDSPNVLRANPNYYSGPPKMAEIRIETFPTVRAAWAELLRNRIDMLWEVGPDALDSLQTSTTVGVFTYIRHYQYMLAFNRDAPALRSSAVRRALNTAVDRNAIVQRALNGHGVPSSGPIWPRYWALPGTSPNFDFDPGRAAAALGVASGSNKTAFRFRCFTLADGVYERFALELKRQFQAVNVEMDVSVMSADQLLEAEKNRNFDSILLDAISAPTILRLYTAWDSRAEGNPGGFGNATLDRAFDGVVQAEDEASYRQAVAGLQQAFFDDPPAIFLAWQQRARAVSTRFAVPAPEPGRDVISTLRLWSPRNNDAKLASRN